MTSKKYNVGGVMLDRPFKIRRLGHFGFNATKTDESLKFYTELLGFKISDTVPFGAFLRHGSEHHSFVLFDKTTMDKMAQSGDLAIHYRAENDINQITWQLQSLREITDATEYLRAMDMDIIREGRANGPGSNYHLYFYDPDEQINEFYYGIEMIGWNGLAKPLAMRHGMTDASYEPHIPEYEEVNRDLAAGLDIRTGHRHEETRPATFDVDGVLLPQPFKVVDVGPVRLFASDVSEAESYYVEVLGLQVTEEVIWEGERCVFLRCNSEHHSLALFPVSLREKLGLSPASSNATFGLQVANYRQLQDAIAFLRGEGIRVETSVLPQALRPGIDYAAYAFDPDGHCLELYFEMEQVGWDGQPKPSGLRRAVDPDNWPSELEASADTYSDPAFLGPWG